MRQWPPVTMPLPIFRVHDRGGRRATTPDRRYVSSASFAYGQAGGTARRSRHGRRGLRRRRRRGWGHQRRQRPDPAGRHPELRRRPGAHRLQQQHLQGQRHLGAEHRHQHVPVQPSTPSRTSRSRWTTSSSTRPSRPARTRRRSSTRSRRTRSGRTTRRSRADDFVYFWEKQNGTIKDNDVASTTGYDQIESVEGSDNGKTVTVVFKNPFADWKGLFSGILPGPLRQGAPGRLEHRPGQGAGEDPLAGWFEGRELHRRPEPDPGPQREVLRAQDQPGLGGLPVPARVDHPAGRAAEQRGRPDLPAAPARPGDPGQGPARRDQRDQLRAVVRALRLQLQERAPGRPDGPQGDRHRHQRPGAGRPHRQAVQRQGRSRSATASG